MDQRATSVPSDLGWADVQACTLPTVERPLRLAEFDDLFGAHLTSVEHDGDTHARLLLAGETGLAERAQRLAEAESSCCSFFTFAVTTTSPNLVALDIEVPPAYAEVLAGLVERAENTIGGAS